jgi:uncharacterized protein (DUF1330 family)
MAAYVIVDIEVKDPVLYEDYRKRAAQTVLAHGGRYVVRGGKAETLEGEWRPNRIVVLEFPSVEKAKEWWGCQEYQDVMKLRHASARTKMIVVEGI